MFYFTTALGYCVILNLPRKQRISPPTRCEQYVHPFVCVNPHSPIHNKGTRQYEPIEVNRQRYLFRDPEDDSPRPDFKFNCIHDLESTWWIALWVLFHHTSLDDQEDRSAQIIHATKLFPSVGPSLDRVDVFLQGDTVRDIAPSLNLTFQTAAKRLIDARKLLVRRYRMAEEGPSINTDAFEGLHQKLEAIWQMCRNEFQDIEYRWVLSSEPGAKNDPQQPPSKKPKLH